MKDRAKKKFLKKILVMLEGVSFRSLSFKLYFLLAILLIISFAGIMYFNITSYTRHINESIMHSAIQASDLIKGSARYSMLKNDREHLQNTMSTIGKEVGVEGVRIYNKPGQISFSDDLTEVGTTVDIDAEQCVVCHQNVPPLEHLNTQNRIRVFTSPKGYRVLGLINPIQNEPECFNAPCHGHSPKDKLLGLLDVKLSLKSVDEETQRTRAQMVLYSSIMIIITALLFAGFVYKLVHVPVRKLAKGTREVANLNLDYSIDFTSKDEMGELAQSFNRMTTQLKSANEANQEWSAILERKVQEKTEELNKAHAHLVLVEKIASLGKLSAIVAHEINNPLSGILTYASLCLKIIQNPSSSSGESVTKYMTVIRDEARRCGEIVKNLLVFAKKDFGKWTEESLHKIIHNSVQLVKHNMDLKEISLVQELAEGDDLMFCDSSGIQQIFVALFINAIEAMSKGGKLTVKTRFLDNGQVQIVISDTGSGIPEEMLPRIFEPFFSTKESTGLGLAVVYRIIEQHEGKVKVASKPNEGTTFTIHLPRSPYKIEERLGSPVNNHETQS
ncbi:MAG: HAMP domain-containing protein [Deltaproteobacteria bacterium]|nr:HAMP domain-containing protein [Deltaproteobacteria bacterium]MBM4322731.1 HAMP domain-containing protein [Deltaproteobacteria bacterium]